MRFSDPFSGTRISVSYTLMSGCAVLEKGMEQRENVNTLSNVYSNSKSKYNFLSLKLICWGMNNVGQAGRSDPDYAALVGGSDWPSAFGPVQVGARTISVAVGAVHTCSLSLGLQVHAFFVLLFMFTILLGLNNFLFHFKATLLGSSQ